MVLPLAWSALTQAHRRSGSIPGTTARFLSPHTDALRPASAAQTLLPHCVQMHVYCVLLVSYPKSPVKTIALLLALGALLSPSHAQDRETMREERRSARQMLRKSAPPSYAVQASPADSLILVGLYNATQGANWVQRAGWLTDPVSDWYGVGLSPSGRVIGLDLQSNGLLGSLPDSLGRLDSLRTMYLADNFIAGAIPESLGQLSRLETLSLWSNKVAGTIPESLGQLGRLRDLLLFDNTLTGPIPDLSLIHI